MYNSFSYVRIIPTSLHHGNNTQMQRSQLFERKGKCMSKNVVKVMLSVFACFFFVWSIAAISYFPFS